jgi:hypothetical protein
MVNFKEYINEKKSIHDPVRPGILKRQISGILSCSKVRGFLSKQKDKGSNSSKAARRFLNYRKCSY